MRALALGVVCAGVLVAACGGDSVAPLQGGILRYRASSAQGAPLLVGSLTLEVHADSTVTGSWRIAWVAGADTTAAVGPQVGSGALSGRQYADGSLQLDLDPLYADNNVFLSATPVVTGLSGSWSWSGFAGPLAGGRFTLTR